MKDASAEEVAPSLMSNIILRVKDAAVACESLIADMTGLPRFIITAITLPSKWYLKCYGWLGWLRCTAWGQSHYR